MGKVCASKLRTETVYGAVVAVPQRHLSAYPCFSSVSWRHRCGDLLMLLSHSCSSFRILWGMGKVCASKLGTETMNCAVVAVPQRHLSAYPCFVARYVTSRYGDLLMLISHSCSSFPIWCAMCRVYASKLGTGTMDSAAVTVPRMQINSYHSVLSSASWRHCCSCSGCPSVLFIRLSPSSSLPLSLCHRRRDLCRKEEEGGGGDAIFLQSSFAPCESAS
jgi:hypothetical protein